MQLDVDGKLPDGITAKDLILYLIGAISTSGGTGHVIEYTGSAIRALSMEERMTVCNMSIEGGARAGMIAPDETTFEYIRGRQFAPADFDAAVKSWTEFAGDEHAAFDRSMRFSANEIAPMVSWGTNPGQVMPISETIPDPASFDTEVDQKSAAAALSYMDLASGVRLQDVPIDYVFIGSCTNARIEDLRLAARIAKGVSCG